MEDRIVLYLHTDSAMLRQAIEIHRVYIANETLTVQWATATLGNDAATANVKIEGHALIIQLREPSHRCRRSHFRRVAPSYFTALYQRAPEYPALMPFPVPNDK